MSNSTIGVKDNQLVEALSQLPPDSLKKLIDRVFRKKLYSPPPLDEITAAASRVVRKEKLGPEVADEAVQWARAQK